MPPARESPNCSLSWHQIGEMPPFAPLNSARRSLRLYPLRGRANSLDPPTRAEAAAIGECRRRSFGSHGLNEIGKNRFARTSQSTLRERLPKVNNNRRQMDLALQERHFNF